MVYSPVPGVRTSSRCCLAELGLFAAELAFALARAMPCLVHPQQADFEFGEGGDDVEDILPMGSVGS